MGSVWLGGVSEQVLVWAEQPRVVSQPGSRSLGVCRLPLLNRLVCPSPSHPAAQVRSARTRGEGFGSRGGSTLIQGPQPMTPLPCGQRHHPTNTLFRRIASVPFPRQCQPCVWTPSQPGTLRPRQCLGQQRRPLSSQEAPPSPAQMPLRVYETLSPSDSKHRSCPWISLIIF